MTRTTIPTTRAQRKSYTGLKHLIKTKIQNNELTVNQKLPTMRHMANDYGMSLATVQRALSELSDAGVLYSIQGNGTYVSQPQRVCNKIGLLCRRSPAALQETIFSPLMNTLQSQALQNFKDISLMQIKKNHKGQYLYLDEQELIRKDVDVLFLINVVNIGFISSLRQFGFPVVATDVNATAVGVHSVYFDNEKSSFDLTNKLLDDGHKDIWYCGTIPASNEDYDLCQGQRYTGYRLAMHARGLKPSSHLYAKGPSYIERSYTDAISQELKLGTRPSAIVGHNPLALKRSLRGLGLDNVEIATWVTKQNIESIKDHAKYLAMVDFQLLGQEAYKTIAELEEADRDLFINKILSVPILDGTVKS